MSTATDQTNANALTVSDKHQQVRALLERSRDEIARALPGILTPERMIRLALTSLRKEEKLIKCEPMTILASVMEAAQLGLEIGGALGQCWLIPYGSRCQLQIGYKGLLALGHRSRQLARFCAHEVCEADQFDFQYGRDADLKHKPVATNRGPIRWVYAEIATVHGGWDFEVMSADDVRDHQKRYVRESSEAWSKSWTEMAKKTVLIRLAKRCPVSTEIQQAVAIDEYSGDDDYRDTWRERPGERALGHDEEPKTFPAYTSEMTEWMERFDDRLAVASNEGTFHLLGEELRSRKAMLREVHYQDMLGMLKERHDAWKRQEGEQ